MPNKKKDDSIEKNIDALRALIGGKPVARAIIKKNKLANANNKKSAKNKTDITTAKTNDTSNKQELPTAIKTLNVGDFLRLKKHNSAQAQLLLKTYVKKHGKLSPNSKELTVLVKALKKILLANTSK